MDNIRPTLVLSAEKRRKILEHSKTFISADHEPLVWEEPDPAPSLPVATGYPLDVPPPQKLLPKMRKKPPSTPMALEQYALRPEIVEGQLSSRPLRSLLRGSTSVITLQPKEAFEQPEDFLHTPEASSKIQSLRDPNKKLTVLNNQWQNNTPNRSHVVKAKKAKDPSKEKNNSNSNSNSQKEPGYIPIAPKTIHSGIPFSSVIVDDGMPSLFMGSSPSISASPSPSISSSPTFHNGELYDNQQTMDESMFHDESTNGGNSDSYPNDTTTSSYSEDTAAGGTSDGKKIKIEDDKTDSSKRQLIIKLKPPYNEQQPLDSNPTSTPSPNENQKKQLIVKLKTPVIDPSNLSDESKENLVKRLLDHTLKTPMTEALTSSSNIRLGTSKKLQNNQAENISSSLPISEKKFNTTQKNIDSFFAPTSSTLQESSLDLKRSLEESPSSLKGKRPSKKKKNRYVFFFLLFFFTFLKVLD